MIDLNDYIRPDDTLDVFVNRDKFIISHDSCDNVFKLIDLTPGERYGNIYNIEPILTNGNTDINGIGKCTIYPRVNNMQLSWCALVPKNKIK